MSIGGKACLHAMVGASLLAAAAAGAQTYPSRPIRFVVGPGPDLLARMVGQRLTDAWGQQVVVDQRPGAGGIIAADTVAKAQPDGYTLLLSTGAYTVLSGLHAKLPYDFERDLAPVSMLAAIPFLVVAHPGVPAKSVDDLVKYARARPGQLNCASTGTGTTAHLGCEMLKSSARIDIVHVPYKGIAPASIDLLAGQAQFMFIVMQAGLPHVRAGKLTALAVTSEKRFAAAADVPTARESGHPGIEFTSFNGVHLAARTPRAVITRLHGELARIVSNPELRARMLDLGMEPVADTPESFAAFVKNDLARWRRVIREAGVKTD